VADNRPESLAWAQRRGFRVSHHKFASSLVLAVFDERPFTGAIERVAASGIRFTSMAELPDTDENRRKLFDLNRETGRDIPNGDTTFPSFEDFCQHVFESDWYTPAGQILALDGDEWVGLSSIRYIPANNSMYHNMTGVRRAHRGRGIAIALKLLTLRYAKSIGADFVRTHNDSDNAPMLAINRKLGYRPEPGVYGLKKGLR
jgi:RimJ/RimL family protein N-acetyltransferase